MADKGYDGKQIVEAVDRSGGTAVIPSRACVNDPRDTNFASYAEHDRIECFFNRITHDRAVATRYAKHARNFASLIYLAATMLWMK